MPDNFAFYKNILYAVAFHRIGQKNAKLLLRLTLNAVFYYLKLFPNILKRLRGLGTFTSNVWGCGWVCVSGLIQIEMLYIGNGG